MISPMHQKSSNSLYTKQQHEFLLNSDEFMIQPPCLLAHIIVGMFFGTFIGFMTEIIFHSIFLGACGLGIGTSLGVLALGTSTQDDSEEFNRKQCTMTLMACFVSSIFTICLPCRISLMAFSCKGCFVAGIASLVCSAHATPPKKRQSSIV